MQRDYYKVMGISSTATEEDIKKTYRKLARQYHPDLNPGDKAAEERFKEIGEAYEVLSDPERRAEYDGRQAATGAASGSAARKLSSPFTEEMYNAMRRQSRDYFDVEAQIKAKKEKSEKRNPLDAGDLFASYFGQVGKEKKKK